MPLIQVTSRHLLVTRKNLERWVIEQARRAQAEHGFSYIASDHAPSTYPALLVAFQTSSETRERYPVSPTNCDNTIFTEPETNWAMRFVHDLEHAKLHLSFSTQDELVLGMHHLEDLRTAGYGPETPEHKLLHADTIGQARCVTLLGRFPYNQRQFDFDCVTRGVDAALELESVRACSPTRVADCSASRKP
jgi:hypothetical protein